MTRIFAAFAAAMSAAAISAPASAITFPTLTTIYVGSGVMDAGQNINEGPASAFFCTNASGVPATIRFLVLKADGGVAGSLTVPNAAHGRTVTAATHGVLFLADAGFLISPGVDLGQGGVIIESTQWGGFCTAMAVAAPSEVPEGIDLHLVRVNPHPGTIE